MGTCHGTGTGTSKYVDIGGPDEVHGESGDDTIYTGCGNDVIFGDARTTPHRAAGATTGSRAAPGTTASSATTAASSQAATSRRATRGADATGTVWVSELHRERDDLCRDSCRRAALRHQCPADRPTRTRSLATVT